MTFCHISAHVQAKTLIKKPVRLHERCKALIESKQMLGLVHLTAEKFDNEASFLQFTLIFHENGAFRKRTSHPRTVYTNPQSRQRNLSGIPFQGVLVEFECGQKMVWKLGFFFFLKTTASQKSVSCEHVISLPEVSSSNTNPKWMLIVAFENFKYHQKKKINK